MAAATPRPKRNSKLPVIDGPNMMGPPIIHAQPAKPSSDTDKLDSVMKSQTNEHLRSSTFSPLRAILYLLNGFVNDIKSKNRPKAVLLEIFGNP
jgi:hypothetical protein